jgi:hypothetical protein
MTDPKPEHRITAVEQRASTIEAKIIEMAADTAEDFKALRQDIKNLDQGMKSSFDEIGDAFTLLDSNIEAVKATMATKEDLRNLEARMDNKLTAMKEELIDAIKQLWTQRPSE